MSANLFLLSLHFHLYSCWSVSQSLRLFFVSLIVCFTSTHLSVFDFLCIFVYLFFFFIHLVCVYVHSTHLACLSVFLADFLSVSSCLSMILYLHLTCVCLSICIGVPSYLSVCLSFEYGWVPKPGTNMAPVPMEPVCTEPNQNADFGAMPERSVEIFVLCFSETDVRSIITSTTRAK